TPATESATAARTDETGDTVMAAPPPARCCALAHAAMPSSSRVAGRTRGRGAASVCSSVIEWERQGCCMDVLVLACVSGAATPEAEAGGARRSGHVRPGISVLLTDSITLIAGKRVGLLT